MKNRIFLPALSLVLAGCANQQPPPPPKTDPLTAMVSVVSAVGQMAQAAKQAPAIRADTAVLFPSRSQAIALGLLSYRMEGGVWPSTRDDLRAFFGERFKDDAPPVSEFDDLKLQAVADGRLSFGFTRPGLYDEQYVLSPDGTISFVLPVQTPHEAVTPPSPRPASGFPWGEIVARLFVELPVRMLAVSKK